MTTDDKRVKKTAVVVRGLISMRELLIDALDDGKPPASTIVARWTKRKQREYNAAMAWLEQEEADYEAKHALKAEPPNEGGN